MSLHKNVAPESRHPTPIRDYANAEERLSDNTLTENEEGGFVWQHDDDSVWMLTSSALGTWLYVSSANLVFEGTYCFQ